MKRNEKEERFKYLRRLDKKTRILAGKYSWRGENLIWVPVEEPQFLGWEVKLVLGEAGLRRSDAPNILAVMDHFGMSRVTFTRHAWVEKLVRSMSGRYNEITKIVYKNVMRRWYGKGRNYYYSDISSVINSRYVPYGERRITQQAYDGVPLHLKGYFERRTERGTTWRPAYYYYVISDKFPRYELRFKVTKAYSTHRGIPKSDEISESDWIEKQLKSAHFRETQDHSSWEAYYHRTTNRAARKHWKSATRQIAKRYDGAEEVVEQQESYVLGRANVIKQGWY